MTHENAASGPPWPVHAVPWPHDRSPKAAGLESLWAVGPADGPVMHFGSAVDPRERWRRLAKASPLPLMVCDLRWAQGRKGRALSRALHRVIADPVDLAEYRFLVEVEAARLGIVLAAHGDVVAAVDIDAQADLDALMAQHRSAEDRYAMEIHPELSLAEIKARQEKSAGLIRPGDAKIEIDYQLWESEYRRSNPPPPRKLLQRNRSIVKAYKDGATLAAIGSEHGISFGRVRRILDDMGVDRRPRGGYFARSNPRA